MYIEGRGFLDKTFVVFVFFFFFFDSRYAINLTTYWEVASNLVQSRTHLAEAICP